jgi:hypothetical protein
MLMRAAGSWVTLLVAGMSSPAIADHIGVGAGPGTSGPITTISASTLPGGKVVLGLRVTYAKPDVLPDAELQGRAARGIEAHTADHLLSPSVGVALGISDDFTIALSLPYLQRSHLRAGAVGAVDILGTSQGVGDLTFLGEYRILGTGSDRWQAAILAGLKAPTGATHEIDRNGVRFETEHQPGTGSWDPLFGVAVTRRSDHFSIDASVLYQLSGQGAQDTTLGDRAQYNVSISHRIGGGDEHHHDDEAAAPHHHHEAAWDLILEANGEWEGRQRVGGAVEEASGGNVIYLSPGVRFVSSAGWSAFLSAGLPIVQDIRASHPDNRFRVVAGASWAF